MTVYDTCNKCDKWMETSQQNYFIGIGLVCKECAKIILKEDKSKKKGK